MKINKRYSTIFSLSLLAILTGLLTTTAQTNPSATPTARPSKTPTPAPAPTMTVTPIPQGTELIFQITSGGDDVNESSGAFQPEDTNLWLGNSGSTSSQYLGLRFTNIAIPPGSVIHAAHLEVYSVAEQWIFLAYDLAAEAADNSEPFASNSLPSQRDRTAATVKHESNVKWLANTWYPLDDIAGIIQEVIDRPAWQANNSLSIIVQGNESGGDFGRKFFSSFENDPSLAVRLVIDVSPSTTATYTATPADVSLDEACSDVALPARLTIGQTGHIDPASTLTTLSIYETPDLTAALVGELEAGMSFTVIDGPVCADGSRWFQVRFGDDDVEGWLAEAQPNPYFVQPSP